MSGFGKERTAGCAADGCGGASRRTFLYGSAMAAAGGMLGTLCPVAAQAGETGGTREALFWRQAPDGRTQCLLCPNLCVRREGEPSQCRTRVNRGGKLYTLTYGNPCLICEDPLAKNPLYHADPGASAIGVATAGCNLTCRYCQNWDISQVGPDRTKNLTVSPEELVDKAVSRGLRWLTFSYTEPVVYYEYAMAAARLARAKGLRVAVVTAGYIEPEPLARLGAVTDAFSVTLKGHSEDFYRDVCGASLSPVLRSLSAIARMGKWIEVVHLVVPGLNDTEEAYRFIARTVVSLGRDVPLHFLRFSPAYKLKNIPRAPLRTLEAARAVALSAGLRYVYIDLPGHASANTTCPRCKKVVIERSGFAVLRTELRRGQCRYCNYRIAGMF